ncbi:ribosome maturation factor RimP [Desulfonatronovibrio magnus]|uniref:ribosome maturation factor RimP n=1 Tax=Desulfonatronovibrio magnus TaxID=698827 RepID=UPI0005EBDBDD|nr:ribosome maturation factor RimP [Desulfonatronovibrio magnus]
MSKEQQLSKLTELAEIYCRALGVYLWGIEYHPGPGGKKGILRIYIEAENGVTIDHCAELSRQISVALDVEDIVPGAYNLEVSSPGLNRQFFHIDQLPDYLGQKVKVVLKTPRDNRKKYSGTLLRVQDHEIIIESDSNAQWTFPWDEIHKINLAG